MTTISNRNARHHLIALCGRAAVKAERADDALIVRAFWPEPGVKPSKAFLGRLEAELERLRRFSGLGRVELGDGWWRTVI